jgi:hypothetical protein
MNEAAFRISPLPAEFVSIVRNTRRDLHGHEVAVRIDQGRHQCRSCLRLTEPNERYWLFSYTPFDSDQPYAETGPIFIHDRECDPYSAIAEYPPEFPRHHAVLRAYNAADEIEDAKLVGERRVEEVIAELFENSCVAYIHARNSEYGCFMFRIDRA